jgi:hypothetical protein
VTGLKTAKAQEYMTRMMNEHRNQISYDTNTGEIKDDRKFLSVLEDIWLPRSGTGKTTEVSQLPGGQNLGKMEDVEYFLRRVYRALRVPESRMDRAHNAYQIGKAGLINRDETHFASFIRKLRNKFAYLFIDLLRTELICKNVCTEEEFEVIRQSIHFDWAEDNYYAELRDQEILQARVDLVKAHLGDRAVTEIYSLEWIKRKIARLTDDEIKEIKKELDEERLVAQDRLIEQAALMASPKPKDDDTDDKSSGFPKKK